MTSRRHSVGSRPSRSRAPTRSERLRPCLREPWGRAAVETTHPAREPVAAQQAVGRRSSAGAARSEGRRPAAASRVTSERTPPRRRRPRHAPAASLRQVSGALRRVGLSFASRSATRSVPLLRTCPLDRPRRVRPSRRSSAHLLFPYHPIRHAHDRSRQIHRPVRP